MQPTRINFYTHLVVLMVLCGSSTSIVKAQGFYTPNDSIRIYKLLSEADNLSMAGSMDAALNSAAMALQISKQKKMLRGEGFAGLKIADIKVQQSDTGNMEPYYTSALRIGSQLKDSFMMALAWYQQGQYIMYDGRNEEAEKLFHKALSFYFEKVQSNYTGLVYNDMGYMFGGKGDLENQVNWYLKAVRVFEKTGDDAGLATTTSSLSSVYFSLGNIPDCLRYVKRAIAIRERIGDIQGLAYSYGNLSRFFVNTSLDSAIRYQQLAMQYAEKSGVKRTLIINYDNASILLSRQNRNAEALEYTKKAIAVCESLNDKAGIANRYMWSAVLCAGLKEYDAVEDYYKKAYELSLQTGNKASLRDIFGSKASYYKNRSDFKSAYDNLKLYYAYRDSVINQQTQTNIASLQLKYQTEKKDNEITRLNADQKIKRLELEKQQAIIAGNMQEAQRKQNEINLLVQARELQDLKIKHQDEELEKQLLLSRANEQQLRLSQQQKELDKKELQNQKQFRNAIIIGSLLVLLLTFVLFNRHQLKKKLEQQQALQRIRNDIARDLHDDIGSTLTSINILSAVSQKNLERNREQAAVSLQQITEQSQSMQQAMSDIVWAIKPDNDKMQNMVLRMREFVNHTLELKNIDVEFNVNENILSQTLPMEQRRDFFLIFKEAVNNAAKYSKATKVVIQLNKPNDTMQLCVTDNGVGFDTSRFTTSNGLKNMKERAEALHGALVINSAPGDGTLVQLQFPATY